jgi:uncharacterized protein (DUF58 family)
MIVPSSRLLVCTSAVVLPIAFAAAAYPNADVIWAVSFLTFAGLVLVDALRADAELRGIRVELPPVVRVSKNRVASLEVRVHSKPGGRRALRLAFGFPVQISPMPEVLDLLLPADAPSSRFDWNCTPLERGNYRISAAYAEAHSPFGLWAVRARRPAQCEIRVYPNLLTERRNLAALFLNRGSYGVHVHRQVGKGRDFEKLREYAPGDSYDEIHWKATARRAKPITKVFQIERTKEIYVVVDASRLSARQTNSAGNDSILERFVTAALVLGLAAEQQGDLFGLVAFTNKIETFVRARNGKTHYNACRDALYTLEPKIVTPDFDELCTFIRLRVRKRALVVFLTSLDDPALFENFVRNVDLIRRQHLILVNMMRQQGAVPLFTDPDVNSIDDVYRQLSGHLRWHKLRQVDKTLQRLGVRFALMDNERLSAQLVSQYLSIKQRQLI